eukprot:403355693
MIRQLTIQLQQYFDKHHRCRQVKQLRPEKTIDPYDMNTLDGTRIPKYSSVYKQRDLHGELGWIPNFQVVYSKNNQNLHPTYKEFFDMPQNYHNLYSDASITASEFFRSQAPDNSVAKQRRVQSSYGGRVSQSFISNADSQLRLSNSFNKRDSFNNLDQRKLTISNKSLNQNPNFTSLNNDHAALFQSQMSLNSNLSKYQNSQNNRLSLSLIAKKSTPFYLVKDSSNKHKIDKRLKETQSIKNQIPFLRVNDDDYQKVINNCNSKKQFNQKVGARKANQQFLRSKLRPEYSQKNASINRPYINSKYIEKFYKQRETKWDQYIAPISQINQELHPSQRVDFTRI